MFNISSAWKCLHKGCGCIVNASQTKPYFNCFFFYFTFKMLNKLQPFQPDRMIDTFFYKVIMFYDQGIPSCQSMKVNISIVKLKFFTFFFSYYKTYINQLQNLQPFSLRQSEKRSKEFQLSESKDSAELKRSDEKCVGLFIYPSAKEKQWEVL